MNCEIRCKNTGEILSASFEETPWEFPVERGEIPYTVAPLTWKVTTKDGVTTAYNTKEFEQKFEFLEEI